MQHFDDPSLHPALRRPLLALLAALALIAPSVHAADPPSGTISRESPTVEWGGGPFVASNPLSCGLASATCDQFALTIEAPDRDFIVTISALADAGTDDLDLFVRDPAGATIASSTTPTGSEEVILSNPPSGTYTVEVQPFLVVPGATYGAVAGIAEPPVQENSNSYHGALYTPDFVGVPESEPASSAPLVPQLKVSFREVGRQAGEPTLGVNADNTAFYAAAAFDSVIGVEGVVQLARTVVLRSRDKGITWEPVSPPFALGEASTTDPVFTLDPMLHLDTDTGRVFSVDLYVGCSNALFSDDEGVTWQRNPLACGQPVNDHHTIVTAPPPSGMSTLGYPNMLYYCFNRVSDSSCGRSNDGGESFVPAGAPAFTGVDAVSGELCGGLHGHLAGDDAGRIFLPKGHCGLPWVAISENGGETWERVQIARHTPMDHHEVSLAVDTADNVYAVWSDGRFRLPFLSVSRDHGRSWSTPIMFAPPGVHEANFPTIIAGDPGRIAIIFPGSESEDFGDPTRPWNAYVVVSTDALDANPTFTWTIANQPGDPVHRGSCGPGRCESENGGNMLDFVDIQTSPADGAFWATMSDTCVGACVTDPNTAGADPGEGIAIRQTKGPSLFLSRRGR